MPPNVPRSSRFRALWLLAPLNLASCRNDPPAAAAQPKTSPGPLEPAVAAPLSPRQAVIARAKSLELATPYVPPPGDALEHHGAGFAKVMCSAVFISGLSPEFAARHVGFFTSPLETRSSFAPPVVDRAARAVHVTLPNGVTRSAQLLGSQGCVTLPAGQPAPDFEPQVVTSALPEAPALAWPRGDAPPAEPLPAGVSREKLDQALSAAFEPSAMTAGFVVVWQGRLLAERYGDGVTAQTPLMGWSMGKSLIATLLGVLIEQAVYALDQRAPIPEWQAAGDPRREIRIADLLQMSSGLRSRAPLDPDYDPAGPYPDHVYLYTGARNAFEYAATRPLEWPPGRVGRYRNTDPVLASYLIRLAVEKRGEDYLSFPQRALFDPLGIRTAVLETDASGNFLTQGYELMSTRDWARLGNLYLGGGVVEGRRLLPAGYAQFVSSPAPAWQADGRPFYGGFFWLNRSGRYPVPHDAYYMSGAGGQTTLIVPSHALVVARLGHDGGEGASEASLVQALALLLEALPRPDR